MSGTASLPARSAAALAPIGVAAILVTGRGVLDRADLALILVLVVVGVAATGDRVAAAIAAMSAAASFDFFLTKPYGSLRVSSARDIETTAILLLIALAVGQVAILGRDRRRAAEQAQLDLNRLEQVAAHIALDPAIVPLIDVVERAVAEVLSLTACRFALERPHLPELRADGRVETSTHTFAGTDFALPGEGVELAVVGGGAPVGWLRMTPRPRVGVSLESRKVAVALSQQLGAALARTDLERGHG